MEMDQLSTQKHSVLHTDKMKTNQSDYFSVL